jgi:hypothetical protein
VLSTWCYQRSIYTHRIYTHGIYTHGIYAHGTTRIHAAHTERYRVKRQIRNRNLTKKMTQIRMQPPYRLLDLTRRLQPALGIILKSPTVAIRATLRQPNRTLNGLDQFRQRDRRSLPRQPVPARGPAVRYDHFMMRQLIQHVRQNTPRNTKSTRQFSRAKAIRRCASELGQSDQGIIRFPRKREQTPILYLKLD